MDQPHDQLLFQHVRDAVEVALEAQIPRGIWRGDTADLLATAALGAARAHDTRETDPQPMRLAHLLVSTELLEQLLLLPRTVHIIGATIEVDHTTGGLAVMRREVMLHLREEGGTSHFLQPCGASHAQVVTPIIRREQDGTLRVERFQGEML